MAPNSSPIIPIVILVAVVGWLLSRARAAGDRSRKLGALATACGVTAFIPALLGPMFRDPGQMAALAACGVLTLLLAVTAVGLAIWTFCVGRRNGGAPPGYLVVGLLCGAANLFCGAGLLVTGS